MISPWHNTVSLVVSLLHENLPIFSPHTYYYVPVLQNVEAYFWIQVHLHKLKVTQTLFCRHQNIIQTPENVQPKLHWVDPSPYIDGWEYEVHHRRPRKCRNILWDSYHVDRFVWIEHVSCLFHSHNLSQFLGIISETGNKNKRVSTYFILWKTLNFTVILSFLLICN